MIKLLIACLFAVSLQQGQTANTDLLKRHMEELDGSFYMTLFPSASFSGPNAAWFTTREGDLLITTDAGEHWNSISGGKPARFKLISFINPYRGWAITPEGVILATIDGGKQWSRLSQLQTTGRWFYGAKSIVFFDEKNGWITEDPFSIWITQDGGTSWKQIDLDQVGSLSSIDSNNGWINSKGRLYRTRDGWKTWETIPMCKNDYFPSATFFLNDKIGWLYCASGGLYNTSDGGKTAELQIGTHSQPDQNISIESVYFLDELEGWAVGQNWIGSEGIALTLKRQGVILHTFDGGKSWNRITGPPKEWVFSRIHFADPNHGWLISRETIYYTIDGGHSWKDVYHLGHRARQ